MNKTCCLITAIGSFSADVSIRSLKAMGFRVLGTDIYPAKWLAQSLMVDGFWQAPRCDEAEYIDFMLKLCIQQEVGYLLPLVDYELDVLNANRALFEEAGIILCISDRKSIELCRNKKLLYDHLNAAGVSDLIDTRWLSPEASSQGFPLISKPCDGRSSQGVSIINDEAQLRALLPSVKGKAYIVQPFIAGDIITVDIIRQPISNQSVALPRLELLRTQNGAGTSVKVFSDNLLEAKSKQIAELLDVKGCVNMEFILDSSSNYRFIECNARLSGGLAFSQLSGYDCLLNHIRCFAEEEIDEQPIIKDCYVARKYQEFITYMQ